MPGWGVMCEACSLPSTQSDMQAHPVGAMSVYMTQADLSHQTGSIYSLIVHNL